MQNAIFMELAQSFNSQILFRSIFALIFFLLAIGHAASLLVLRRKNDPRFKFFLIVLFVVMLGAGLIFGISARRYYLNKNIVKGGAQISQTSGVLEKYSVRTGKFGEVKKYEYNIGGEKYDVWPRELLAEAASGDAVLVYYIELWDENSFGINKKKRTIINYEAER